MDDFELNIAVLRDGVYILTEINNEFESIYLKVRENEKRIYADDELINLSFPSNNNPHKKEWNIRAKSYNRFKEYLRQKKDNLNILDLGCGNGWFSGQLSKSLNHYFYCVDVNLTELTQGRRVFNSNQIKFIYADIFTAELPTFFFDIIIMNASVQYFQELNRLVNRLLSMLNKNGEIHIIDSPIYSETEVNDAKKRTEKYYQSLGFPEMASNYFHRSWKELSDFNWEISYNSNSAIRKFKKIFLINDSPFPWIRIKK